MRFSRTETKDLLTAWALLSVAFGILISPTFLPDLNSIIVSAVTVGIGFLLHELAHKFVAQRFGKFAEFRASLPMLLLSIVLAFGGLLIAAPGAVMVSGFVNRRENGLIGAAGPVSNVALCLVFLPIFLLSSAGTLLHQIGGYGFGINALLALFNMLPFWMFDGAKIIAYNKLLYGAIVAVSVVLLIGAMLIGAF